MKTTDDLIYLYGETQRGVGYVERLPSHDEVIRVMMKESPEDQWLLLGFAKTHDFFRDIAPVPEANGFCGEKRVRDSVGPMVFYCNETTGECPEKDTDRG